MADKKSKTSKSLSNEDIVTHRGLGRRTFMGIMAAGTAAAAALTPSQAAAADSDGRPWEDVGSCPRGRPNGSVTDNDLGNGADPSGQGRWGTGATDSDPSDPVANGRGAPYC